jgi:hypothetical protein
MKICVQKCEELDWDNSRHCVCRSEADMEYRNEHYPDGCPCGNTPLWKEVTQSFIDGEWVESNLVQEMLGFTFKECFTLFDFSRTAEWWGIVGKTEEERAREGQKITCYFKRKEMNKSDDNRP